MKTVTIPIHFDNTITIHRAVPIVTHLSGFGNDQDAVIKCELTVTDFKFSRNKPKE